MTAHIFQLAVAFFAGFDTCAAFVTWNRGRGTPSEDT
jgi:hypothetical protein